MSTSESRRAQMEANLEAALAEQASILEQIAPLQVQYDELAEQINELDAQQRPIGNQLKVLRAPLYDLSKEISGLNVALGKEYTPKQDPSEIQQSATPPEEGSLVVEVPEPPAE